ncbi:polysaccharide deacetylase family protein [Haloterrigena alkaliphila]|uniref:Polysaccharide deacetylase family protein n=1 Tax=Haloterrigena alkaliphila TaxID=2816475 RepID=A0A8A2VGE7_9EURY|nr:polysaccharide deacetylase family protein [Haloterrigena alkaliphila]QSW99422.1 polysaccharide deacetylase family protein [Haloterrigena alkaliphila]
MADRSFGDDYEFALCLTHDVDRPYKTFQSLYYAAAERDPSHLRSLVTDERPYWQFEELMALEDDLGVRSAFYFLNEKRLREKSPSEWLAPRNWMLYTGRYDVRDPEIVDVIRALDDGGWEVGLHGSYESYDDRQRLRYEKGVLEDVLGDRIRGGRQHYLNTNVPETWDHHRSIGLRYDASYRASPTYGFDGQYDVLRPFGDDFVVFPLTIMEIALRANTPSVDAAWRECRRLLEEACERNAVMTVLWHPRYFNTDEFEGYRTLYERTIREAKALGGWVGPPGECYERLVSATP